MTEAGPQRDAFGIAWRPFEVARRRVQRVRLEPPANDRTTERHST